MTQENSKLPFVAFRKSSHIIRQGVTLTKYYIFGIKYWTQIVEGPYLDLIDSPTYSDRSKGVDAEELLRKIHSGNIML